MEDGGDHARAQSHLKGAAMIQLQVECRPRMTRSSDFSLKEKLKNSDFM